MSMNAGAADVRSKGVRYPILDALRCVFALWVTVDHVGRFPLFAAVDTGTGFGHLLARGWITVIWGIPAVIGFFVISGFCIHLPFRQEGKLPVARYYARRYTRILLPVAVAILLSRAFGIHQPVFGAGSILWNSVLWSLACEELYYAVYPAARLVRNRFGWTWLLAPIFLCGLVTSLLYPNALDGTLPGTLKTAIILFPIWLLGCLLAEQSDHLPRVNSRATIWKWRLLAWFGSWICEMLHFHAKMSLELTLLGFGVLAYFWIRKEIAYRQDGKAFRTLAWAGLWSYSLYLLHVPAAQFIERLHLANPESAGSWVVLYALVLGMTYLFYLCIEMPSHRLARRIRLSPARRRDAAAVPMQAVADSPVQLADGLVRPQGGLG
jgi:peptidoglycan/LPS O-acetylase OafA/YrhL